MLSLTQSIKRTYMSTIYARSVVADHINGSTAGGRCKLTTSHKREIITDNTLATGFRIQRKIIKRNGKLNNCNNIKSNNGTLVLMCKHLYLLLLLFK